MKPTRSLSTVIFSLFLVLFAGSLFFARERILFCDASFIFTEVLNSHSLAIQEHRYGSFITQAFPLLGSMMHLPLSALVILYSASFNLFYLTVVCLLLFRFKNHLLAVLMAFYYTLFVSDTYFWTNNEIHQAMAWLFLFAGVVLDYRHRKYHFGLHFLLFVLLAFLSLFTHPLISIVLPFLWLFIILEKDMNPYPRKKALLLSGTITVIGIIKYGTMNQGTYDTGVLHNVTHFSIADILGSFTSPMAGMIASKLLSSYYFIPVLFVTGVWFAYRDKKYKQITLVMLFMLGYFVAMCLTFQNFTPFYTESEWMPVTLITGILFVYYTLPRLRPQIAVMVLILIFSVRLGYIAAAAPKFTARTAWIYSVLDKMTQQGISKGYLLKDGGTESRLIISWGLPTESLIASSLRKDDPVKTFVIDSPEGIAQRMVSHGKMIASFGPWEYRTLNTRYFPIDTMTVYRLVDSGNIVDASFRFADQK